MNVRYPFEYDSSVTFADLPDSLICDSEPISDNTPLYTFNHDIYGMVSIPRNILRPVPNKKGSRVKDISVPYHMPDWKYSEFTPSEQEEFMTKFFPNRMTLYKKISNDKERIMLFVYLWMYKNGGVYISSNYEVIKSLDSLFVTVSDLYFTFDQDRYISSDFFASQPFCEFWMELVDVIANRHKNNPRDISSRTLLTKISETTHYKLEIIPRAKLDPYTPCDVEYNKESYLCPYNRDQSFATYMSCQTGTTNEELYLATAIIVILVLMFIITLMTK